METLEVAPSATLGSVAKPKAKKKAKRPAKSKTRKSKPKAKKRVVGPKKGQYRVISAKRKRPTKARKSKPKAKAGGAIVRTERLDMRLSKAEKAKIMAKAKKTRRTVTSLIVEAIEKIKS